MRWACPYRECGCVIPCSVEDTHDAAVEAVRWEAASRFESPNLPAETERRLRVGEPAIDRADFPRRKRKMYDFHPNITPQNLVEIGERGMLEQKEIVRDFLKRGAHFYPMWKVRTELGIEGLCRELEHAYTGTSAVYVHFDMDVLGGAGPAPGDILGELAEPIGMTDYEVIRVAHEIGKRGLTGMSFVYVIMYMLAGRVLGGGRG